MKHLILSLLLLAAAVGTAAPAANSPSGTPGQSALAGKVIETTNAASYTYVYLDTGSNKVWAAAPRFPVKPGDSVTVGDAMPMEKYHSKTLKRDFDVVYFTANVLVNGARPNQDSKLPSSSELPAGHPPLAGAGAQPSMPPGHPPIAGESDSAAAQMPKDHPQISGAPEKTKVDLSGIKKAPGGHTVAEVYAGKDKLKGKSVTVRGKVVRFNSQIMGRNWIHLQDGSGKTGSNDLLVTSSSEVKVGDTITVTGKLALNKDFGANYKYPVMIEDARIAME